MKKYLLLFCFTAVSALFAYSQSLTLSDSAGPIANNSTKLVYGSPSADEILSHVFVKNTSSGAITVKVKKVEMAIQNGTMNLLCWGLCYAPEVFVSIDSIVIAAGATNETDFSGHYLPQGVVGISTIRYVFYDMYNPTDSVCVNVDYSTYPQGISKVANDITCNVYPNPANQSANFTFSVPQDSDARLIIRNLVGNVVKDIPVTGNTGQIKVNTSDLAEGLYFYSVLINGTSQVAKKLVVKH